MHGIMTFIERFRLNVKLIIGMNVGIVVAIVVGLHALAGLERMEADMEAMYDKDLLGISHIKEANIQLITMGRQMRHMLIAQDEQTRDSARSQIAKARETLRSEMAEARKRIFRAEAIETYEKFQRTFARYVENVDHAVAMIEREKSNPSVAAKFITSAEFMQVVASADEELDRLTKIKEDGSRSTLEATRRATATVQRFALIMLLIGVLLAIAVGILIGASIRRPSERLQASVEELAAGRIDQAIPHTDYPNEIGVMARAIQVLQKIYRDANAQHWVKSNAAEIGAALQQAEDFRTLTQTAVSKIAPIIGAGLGAFYVQDADNRYVLTASYGYRERKGLNNAFTTGEGLVGQCAMEKAPILLTAPKDYIRINSGLGEAPPACIMVLPIIHGDRVLGVLEVASFQLFTEREKAVLEALMPILAVNMEILDRNLKTRELLTATQEQAERMEKQAAQMEEQSVEMEAQQAELLETENWFRSIIEAAPNGMLVTDASGRILLTNPELERIFGYQPGELVGGQIEQLVPERVRGGHGGLRQAFMGEGRSRAMGSGPSTLAGRCKDGSEVNLAVTLSPLPPRGTRGKCVSVSVRRIET